MTRPDVVIACGRAAITVSGDKSTCPTRGMRCRHGSDVRRLASTTRRPATAPLAR